MKHMLLVDDEPEVIDGLQQIFKQLGSVTIHTALLASQAMKIVDEYPISLVFADIRMPGMNGIEMWKRIHQRRARCRVVFLSGVRDFDNIYKAIQNPNARFLTKMEPEEKILATAQDVLSELEQEEKREWEHQSRLLQDFFTGSSQGRIRVEEELRKTLFFDFPPQGMNLAVCYIPHAWTLPWQAQSEMIHHLCSFVGDVWPDEQFLCIPIHNSCILLLESPQTQEKDSFPSRIERIFTHFAFQKEARFRCICATGIRSFSELYRQYVVAMDQSMLNTFPDKQVLALDQSETESNRPNNAMLQRLRMDLQSLHNCLVLGQSEYFRDMIVRAFGGNGMTPYQDQQSQYLFFSGVLTILYQELSKHGDMTLCERIRREQIDHRQEKMLEQLLNLIPAVFDALHPSDPYAHPEVVISVRRYISDHLDTNLSLSTLSAHFGMNPNYLSRIFHENTGCKLYEYITRQRLSHAELLLRNTRLSVSKIANQSGYDSLHSFIRAFRREYGQTPTQYRATQGGKEADKQED